jgi:hypothetical protein
MCMAKDTSRRLHEESELETRRQLKPAHVGASA